MASTTAHTGSSLECNYLRSHASPIPHVFTSEQAELVHVSEQIRLLDDHISQLNTLRSALHDRSRQLRNSLSPIQSLPVEVLSRIFQQATEREVYNHPKFQGYREFLRQAFALSSVSAHFRHAALCTPELWRRIPLKMTAAGEMNQLVSLLRHCMTFAHKVVDVSVDDKFDKEEPAHLAIETPGLFTYDVTRRIKSFDLSSSHGLDVWQSILKGSNFPMLDSLSICGPNLYFDLGTLSAVTRLEIRNDRRECEIIMPLSVRYLFLDNAAPDELVSMLSYCPYLEECLAFDSGYYCRDAHAAQFDEPLTLTHLKRLTLDFIAVIMTPSLAQNLRLPSLEYLQLKRCDAEEFDGFLPFCQNVSATLTTLKLELVEGMTAIEDHLYQLCRLSIPNLRKLGLTFTNLATMRSAIYELAGRAEECSEVQLHYLPSLAALTLRYDSYGGYTNDGQIDHYCLLHLLEIWRVGETSYFHLKIKEPVDYPDRRGSQKAEMELRSIVGYRQIGITWNGKKVHNPWGG